MVRSWKQRTQWVAWGLLAVWMGAVSVAARAQDVAAEKTSPPSDSAAEKKLETATFGSGCFWCTEAIFQQLKGVHSVVSGYSGGQLPNPTYEQVLTGLTGHAEVIQIQFDPEVISYQGLLEVFWRTHDPTTLNRQGNDIGTQYRSVIFYHSPEQQKLAEHFRTQLNTANAFGRPVVTEISPYSAFYEAEEYHQNYFARNRNKSYCKFVIAPKLDKFKKVFKDHVKAPGEK
jgi:peptide-methionine (S)-S-oxide reductase